MQNGDDLNEHFGNASRLAFDVYALVRLLCLASADPFADIQTQENWNYLAPISQDNKQWEQLVKQYHALTPRERMVSGISATGSADLLTRTPPALPCYSYIHPRQHFTAVT